MKNYKTHMQPCNVKDNKRVQLDNIHLKMKKKHSTKINTDINKDILKLQKYNANMYGCS